VGIPDPIKTQAVRKPHLRVRTKPAKLQLASKHRTSPVFTLYYAPHTCSLASHIALEDADAPYELKRIDFRASEQQSPGYVALNPEARLAPLDDPFAFAEIQAFNSYLCSTVHVAHAHRVRGSRWADDPASFADMKRKVPQSVGACYDLIESRLLKGPWVMGEVYTIADPYLFTVAQWLEDDGVDPARIPRVMEHRSAMLEMPNVKKAIAAEFAA